MAKIKDIIRDRFKNYIIVILLMAVIALGSIVILILDCPEWLDVLANSILGAVIGASLVDLACSIAAGKEAEDDMRKGIMETLCPGKTDVVKPELYSLYKREAIEPILQQCLSAYCAAPQLSSGYLSYIRNSCRHVKRSENYKIEVCRDDNGMQTVSQTLKQTPVFKPEPTERPYFQAYFIFKDRAARTDNKGALDKVMNDKSYFFREDLADDTFVQELLDAKAKAEADGKSVTDAVLAKLNFSVDIFKNEKTNNPVRVKNEDFLVEFDECGVRIKTMIPEDYVVASDQFFDEEGFVQYTACMKTGYRIPACQNTFYVVYAIPTLKSHFSITFNMGVRNFVDKVDYMTFMSIDQSSSHDDEHDGIMLNRGNTFTFDTSRIVFPRSGMSFTWDGADE